ncbi:MAG: tRNA (guanine26-N2/guanine27-N2)-dimethyltransferase, partial [Euryarchaeota archaeon]|nr:tRNA (guanine26-N2/guanine27-N2)-dimethyltransferase [Euryarchaeota archaeon]
DHHSICERLSITPGKIDEAIERLIESGYQASRTHFCGLGIKTNAGMTDVEMAIRPD